MRVPADPTGFDAWRNLRLHGLVRRVEDGGSVLGCSYREGRSREMHIASS
jgi:hypothetical protein